MSRKQTKNFALIVEKNNKTDNDSLELSVLLKTIKELSNEYYVILHDKDIDLEKNELERPHYHVVMKNKIRTDKMALINKICKIASIYPEMITASENYTLNESIRYLIHLDDSDKYQYAPFEVKTNNQHKLRLALTNSDDDVDTETLLKLLLEKRMTKTKLIKTIGLVQFRKNSQLIKWFWDDRIMEREFLEQNESDDTYY